MEFFIGWAAVTKVTLVQLRGGEKITESLQLESRKLFLWDKQRYDFTEHTPWLVPGYTNEQWCTAQLSHGVSPSSSGLGNHTASSHRSMKENPIKTEVKSVATDFIR